jgi:Tol biopolymer transport system component/DNA-binding winged helix-turn-helix (wHTH) protein
MSQTLPSPIAFPEVRRNPTYRFGLFELDTGARELRRSGVKIRLQDQPFQVLQKLLENAGTVVTREDLQSTLWSQDTFVDFETSLNTAIKRLREVLGDSADVPIFVETVPRRGYRFIAPVVTTSPQTSSPVHASAISQPLPMERQGQPTQPSRLRAALFCLVLILAAAFGAAAEWLRAPTAIPRITDWTQLTFNGTAKRNLHRAAGQIFFNELEAGQLALVQLPEAGGLLKTLESSPMNSYVADVSNDGRKLLVGGVKAGHEGGNQFLRLMDLPSASVRVLSVPTGNHAIWTPKGEFLISRDNALYLSDPDGKHERRLVSLPGEAFYLRYSPDGRRIRFSVAGMFADTSAIWEATSDGTNAHPILAGFSDVPRECCGEWTPDGRHFTFISQHNGLGKIWIRREAPAWFGKAGKPMQLTTEPLNFECAVPSEDGKKLFVCAGQPRAELNRLDSKTGEFVPYLGGISAGDLEPSRDGSQLAYAKYPERTLWRSSADGSQPVQLTGSSLQTGLPHWSPDDSQIAFSGAAPGQPWNVYLISSHGGPAEQITHGNTADLDASWSPDGKKLAFSRAGSSTRADGVSVVDIASTYAVYILDVASLQEKKIEGSDGMCCPRWSPDGRYLVGTTSRNQDLVLYDFAAHKWSSATSGLLGIGYMQWSKDSKYVIFDTQWVKDPTFYRLRVEDKRLETIKSLLGIQRFIGSWGSWTGVASDGSPLIVRDVGHQEIYAFDWVLP